MEMMCYFSLHSHTAAAHRYSHRFGARTYTALYCWGGTPLFLTFWLLPGGKDRVAKDEAFKLIFGFLRPIPTPLVPEAPEEGGGAGPPVRGAARAP